MSLPATPGFRLDGRRALVENAFKAEGVKQVIDDVLIAERTTVGATALTRTSGASSRARTFVR